MNCRQGIRAEEVAEFLQTTRIFTKNRKNWPGKKKPRKEKTPEDLVLDESKRLRKSTSKRVKIACLYCSKSYTNWEKHKCEQEEDAWDEFKSLLAEEPEPEKPQQFCRIEVELV